MTKDRLSDLQKVPSNLRSSSNSIQLSIQDSGSEENTPMEAILRPYSEIRIQLNQMLTNINTMRQIMQVNDIRNTNEKQINELQNQNLHIGNSLMNQFQVLKANLPSEDDYRMESRIKRTLFSGLYQSFINLWNKNEEFLQEYEQNLKTKLQRHTKILNYNTTEEELEELIANKTTNLFVGNILEDIEKERRTLRNLFDRFGELKRLEKSIEEVHSLFIRIQTLVMEQGEIVQRVEYHVQKATDWTGDAANDLEKADMYHKKALKKKIILIIILIILLLIILLAVFM